MPLSYPRVHPSTSVFYAPCFGLCFLKTCHHCHIFTPVGEGDDKCLPVEDPFVSEELAAGLESVNKEEVLLTRGLLGGGPPCPEKKEKSCVLLGRLCSWIEFASLSPSENKT